ncbi:MAG: thiamine pyrophosphate-binding protein [Thaumarchaeota archaeon]|nr:thiamine pyrophosphate-binding protein [Nitrososphaerota archaeon]
MNKQKKTSSKAGKTPEYASDLVIEMMKAYGIKYAALNTGASFRGIQDSIVNYNGNKDPELIECAHEEAAVAIAHGYAKAAGKPMAAICHNVVGLLHANMAIYDAFADRVPVLIFGGTGPMDTTKRRPWIDWIHTALVQGNLVRDYVKWDDQPASIASIPESFARAYTIATTAPKGPVYTCYDIELQEKPITTPVKIPDTRKYSPPTPTLGDPAALTKTAEMLLEAENPVIMPGTTGRNHESVKHLIRLADVSSTPVSDGLGAFNFPNTHPLDVTGTKILESADLILALDVQNILANAYQTGSRMGLSQDERTKKLRSDVKVVSIGLDHLAVRSPITDYQALQEADIRIAADTSLALPYLADKCTELVNKKPAWKKKLAERYARGKKLRDESLAKWAEQSKKNWDASPLSPARLAYEIWQVISKEDWVLAVGTMAGWARKLWVWNKPQHYHGDSGGGGVGYGPGGSIGVALAYKGTGKLVLAMLGDGDTLMTCNAFWTAAKHNIPLLVILQNNHSYLNDYYHQVHVAEERGRDVGTARIGTEVEGPAPDFAKLAESLGCYGEGPIDKPDDIRPALRRAVRTVKEKKTLVLVDTITQKR